MEQREHVVAVAVQSPEGSQLRLLLASFLALYFELVVIRYLSTEIRVFAYVKNLPLIASFFGLGIGMILGGAPKRLSRAFPFLATLLFLLIGFAPELHLVHIPFPPLDYVVWGSLPVEGVLPHIQVFEYLLVTVGILMLLVAFFIVLGGIVGREFSYFRPLPGYSINLVGSLLGILAFTALSYLDLPPAVWLCAGLLAAFPFLRKHRRVILLFLLVVVVTGVTQRSAFWSPYYRINLVRRPPPTGWTQPSAYLLTVNHDYHQKLIDLSPAFVSRYPTAEPNCSALPTYELPYQLIGSPKEVLVVGAGTGNDVAAALRHGVEHIDAVEIDPLIYRLGVRYHPERPYSSPRVTMFIDDARAFFKKTHKTYDLIVFGYLDSHTLLSSFSSVRLDNYVYTLESFQEARGHLRQGGSLVLAFAGGHSFLTERIFATLAQAFGVRPRAYYTHYDTAGVVFLEGAAQNAPIPVDFPEITDQLVKDAHDVILATDNWPFLYLIGRTIPFCILWVLIPFLFWCFTVFGWNVGFPRVAKPGHLHLFFLGAAFLLLETGGVTRLSLLFGSTWVVNAVVIGSFISMAFLANTLVMFRTVSRRSAYLGLFLSLGLNLIFPYAVLDGLQPALKVIAAAAIVGLPVFFSGLVFSRSFRDFDQPSQALGVNLLGAVIGGTLENFVMVGGTPILGRMAIAVYALSAVFLPRSRTPSAASSLPAAKQGSASIRLAAPSREN